MILLLSLLLLVLALLILVLLLLLRMFIFLTFLLILVLSLIIPVVLLLVLKPEDFSPKILNIVKIVFVPFLMFLNLFMTLLFISTKPFNLKEFIIMVLKIYAVYDSVAGSYGLPFYCENDGVALRSFSALSLDPSSYVSK